MGSVYGFYYYYSGKFNAFLSADLKGKTIGQTNPGKTLADFRILNLKFKNLPSGTLVSK